MSDELKELGITPGYLKVKVFEHKLNHPRTGEEVRHKQECVMRPDSVSVLIHRPVDNKYVWVEQFRIGPGTKEPHQPTTIEPVAGMIDNTQTPEEAARREVEEEVHLKLTSLEKVSTFYMCPGVMNERMHLFYGTVDSLHVDEIGGLEEENEFIKVHVWSAEQTEAAMASGRMNTAQAMLLWQWAKLNGKVPGLGLQASSVSGTKAPALEC